MQPYTLIQAGVNKQLPNQVYKDNNYPLDVHRENARCLPSIRQCNFPSLRPKRLPEILLLNF